MAAEATGGPQETPEAKMATEATGRPQETLEAKIATEATSPPEAAAGPRWGEVKLGGGRESGGSHPSETARNKKTLT